MMSGGRLLPVLLLLVSGCLVPRMIETEDGVRVAYETGTAESPRGTAILVHGLGSNYDEWYTFSSFLNREGWSTIRFDLRGHGESTRWKEDNVDWQELTEAGLQSAERDLEAVHGLAEGPVWLIGSSFGANLAARYASGHEGIEGIVLLSPGFGYSGIDPREDLPRFRGAVFAAGSSEDYDAARVAAEIAAAASGPVRVRELTGAGHGSRMLEAVEDLDQEIVRWMNQNTA